MTARSTGSESARGHYPLVHASRRDFAASIAFRYLGGIVAVTTLFVLHDRLPYPHPQFALLLLAFLGFNTLLVPTLLFLDRLPLRIFLFAVAICDLAVALGAAHFTGGYLSPFLITPLLTVMGVHSVYLAHRYAGTVAFAIFAAGLVGMTVVHRTGWLPCPVPYAARLIQDDAFFYMTFPPLLILFTIGFLMVRSSGGSTYVTISEILATNQRLVERMAVQSEPAAGSDFLRMVADSFGGDRAFLVSLADAGEPGAVAEIWPATSWTESPAELAATAPARRALSDGKCLVRYGASRAFPECRSLASPRASGCWITTLRDETGKPIGLLGVLSSRPLQLDHKAEFLMDLFTVLGQTAVKQKLAQRAASSMLEQLHHSRKMEALGQLAGGVAHDFNNLLTVVTTASDMLTTELKDRPELAEYADSILVAGQRGADLVGRLLTFARRAPLGSAPVDVHASLLEVRRLLAHTLDKRIQLDFQLGAACSTVVGDASQIQNALLNVALNARDAMPEGGTLQFSTTTVELGPGDIAQLAPGVEAGRFVEISCRDTGAGMSPEVIERAFDPFFTTKETGKGTGLGLAAVYGCAQGHGGFVRLESTVGAGTCVRIVLPVRDVSVEAAAAAPEARSPVAAARILLADDEPEVAKLMARGLERAGYAVDACPDGAAAVERYCADPFRYDLALLDVMMPRLDGRQAFDALTEVTPGLPCIFVSGYSDETRIAPLLSRPGCGFVQKPFVMSQLLDAVRRALDGVEQRVPQGAGLGNRR